MKCKNCKHDFNGNYCFNCGQNSKVERINFEYLIDGFQKSVLQVNRGFFYTIKELLLRPGHTLRCFLSGERKNHYRPIGFLLITTSIYIITTHLLNNVTFFDNAINGIKIAVNESYPKMDLLILNWITKYQAYIPILILPVYSISSSFAFSKYKYNFYEHLVLNIYITGQQMLIYWLLGFVFGNLNEVSFIVGIFYNIMAYIFIFNDKKISNRIGLIILTYMIFFVLLFILLTIAGLFGGLIIALLAN